MIGQIGKDKSSVCRDWHPITDLKGITLKKLPPLCNLESIYIYGQTHHLTKSNDVMSIEVSYVQSVIMWSQTSFHNTT